MRLAFEILVWQRENYLAVYPPVSQRSPKKANYLNAKKKAHVSSQPTLKTICFKLKHCRKSHSLRSSLKWKIGSGYEKYLHVVCIHQGVHARCIITQCVTFRNVWWHVDMTEIYYHILLSLSYLIIISRILKASMYKAWANRRNINQHRLVTVFAN